MSNVYVYWDGAWHAAPIHYYTGTTWQSTTLHTGNTLTTSTTPTAETTQNGDTLTITPHFTLLNNQWGNPAAAQRIWTTGNGTYGWTVDAPSTTSGINYPEVFIGTRPWGSTTGTPEFPIKRGDITDFTLHVDANSTLSGGEWDFAEEWWLMDQDPTVTPETHQYEIMLLLDWGGGHDHGTPRQTGLWTDQYGNTIDLWARYESGGTAATFYIFRVQNGHDGGKINLHRIVKWLTTHEGIREDLWLSGVELGNEYWPGASGQTTLTTCDVTINGTTYTS